MTVDGKKQWRTSNAAVELLLLAILQNLQALNVQLRASAGEKPDQACLDVVRLTSYLMDDYEKVRSDLLR